MLEARTPVPLLPGNAFVHAVGTGELYYALTGIALVPEETRIGLGVRLPLEQRIWR